MALSSTETRSCFSSGNASRNQPTQPAIARIAPRRLTAILVTSPANSSVKPKARTIGHAVGAGSSTVFINGSTSRGDSSIISEPICSSLLSSGLVQPYRPLSSNDVNDREYHNPHCIDEVPIERQDVNSIRVLLLDSPR